MPKGYSLGFPKRKGKCARGEAHPNSKLSNEDVSEIRNLSSIFNREELAKIFDCSKRTIVEILSGRRRKE